MMKQKLYYKIRPGQGSYLPDMVLRPENKIKFQNPDL